MTNRMDRLLQQYPDPLAGYELNPEQGFFSVIIPEATTNLITNPSVEGGVLTGYTGVGGAIASTYDWQAHGAYGLKITPAISTESGFYFGTVGLAAGSTYTASITIQGEAGKTYYIYFATTGGALLGAKRPWIGTGHKQRIWVTYPETASLARRVYVTRDARYSDQNLFYADGLQVEAKSYPTTYCDGDQQGFLRGQIDYIWNGTPRASTSSRSVQSRAGGREVKLLDLGLRVLAIIGLGMAPLVDQSLPMPGYGELPQGTGLTARGFSIVGALDFNNLRHGQALRSDLIDAIKPDSTLIDQPMILRYQGCDEEGNPTGESLDIICKYRSGLEGNTDNLLQERLSLNFKMYFPLIRATFSGGAALGFQTTVANANYILERKTTGEWIALLSGTNNEVQALALGPDGSVYLGGFFTDLQDVNGDFISRWDGTIFNSVGFGLQMDPSPGGVNALAVDLNGNVYAGGWVYINPGSGLPQYFVEYTGGMWNDIGGPDRGYAMVIGLDGCLYVSLGNGIQKWDGVSLTTIAVTDGFVYALAVGKDGSIYAGGDFTTIGGMDANRVAKWNGSSWSSLGNGLNGTVYNLAVAPDGSLYIGGAFTAVVGIPYTSYIVKWNGTFWQAMTGALNGAVRVIAVSPDGLVYVAGDFTSIGGRSLPDKMAMWTGSTWIPLDVKLPGAGTVHAMLFDRVGNLYLGFSTGGSATSASVNVMNTGSASAYPKVVFTGPGSLWQLKNYTTGLAIYFNLTLLPGEVATLNLDPMNPSFSSNFRSNLLNTVLPGADFNFPLAPGNNNISAYFYGNTSAATAIALEFVNYYWSLDGAAFK